MRHHLALVTVASGLLAACTPTEGTGCPESPECSPLTPGGLTFTGGAFGDKIFIDSSLKYTATGGTQTIWLRDAATDTPLMHSFQASTDSIAFAIESQLERAVRVRADIAGDDRLHIVDTADVDRNLFDRVALVSHQVINVVLRTPWNRGEATRDNRRISLWPGATVPLVVALLDGGGMRLVDEDLGIDINMFPAVRTGWDTTQVTGTGTRVDLRVVLSSGPPRNIPLPVTSEVERIDAHEALETTRIESSDMRCFAAIAGETDILGAPWRLSLVGDAIVRETFDGGPNCIEFESTQFGQRNITITARIDGKSFEKKIKLSVVASAARTASRAVTDSLGPTPGEPRRR